MILAVCLACALFQEPNSAAVYPKPVKDQPSPEFVAWPGFGFVGAQGRQVLGGFAAPGDWSPVEAAGATLAGQSATEWPIRVFIIKRVDQVKTLEDGTLYEEKCALETVDVDRVTRAFTLLQNLVSVETNGAVRLKPQITVDSEPLTLGARTLDQAMYDYTTPRINGGRYDAEDKVYRGPYSSVFVLHGVPAGDGPEQMVNGTPLDSVSVYGFPGYEAEGALALALASKWTQTIESLARNSGVLGALSGVQATNPTTGLLNPLIFVPDGNWDAISKGADLPAPDIQARLKLPYATVGSTEAHASGLISSSYKGVTCSETIADDPERGSVLTYSERGEARNGGITFPSSSSSDGRIAVDKTPTLDFWVKSASHDPLAIEFVSPEGKAFQICLGEDLSGPNPIFQANVARDGSWQHIKLDLRQTGMASIGQIRLRPTQNCLRHPKITQGPILYSFGSFALNSDAADLAWKGSAPASDSTNPWLRARWAHAATPSPQLLTLLKDPEWFVRLNAIERYIASPDPSAEAALTENATLDIDGPAAAAAIEALWKLATPSAKAVVHANLKTGVTELGKAKAARIIGETKDTALAPELIPLQQSRGLVTRMAVVDALGDLPGENAAIIRMTFLYQEDPELKLEVTRTSDPSDPYQWKKLLWSSVNEGSDAVRLVSYEKLSQSSDPEAKKGGFAGIKDDSINVRIQFLEFLKLHPSENNREGLRQAVADRSARVRAAAIEAFSVLEKGVKLEEIGAAATDAHPIVQLALIDLLKTNKFSLPDEALERMSHSPDPRVVSAFASIVKP